ncbi:glycosyltransferase family 4 protein [Halorarum halobium]|uniref:glycosyltransferase family 4 protein n=1 Tax=Halorarum halobium TaxID=3075121 RepID=UPI0028AA149C|nr:glycosyltransferase family 4 protein [Halobaculum sp. XH14]
MTEPHVLHLITRFHHGGAEETTINTLEALATDSRAYNLQLGVGASYDSDRLASIEEWGINTVVFDSIRHYNPVAAVIAVVAVARYLRREEIRIVHTHSTEAGIIGRFAARLADVPIVIHEIHGDPVTSDRNQLLNATICRLERLATNSETILLVKSEHIKQAYLDRGIGTSSQYRTIYHGVDLELFQTATPVRDDGVPIVLFIGRLADGKGLYDLLNAVQRLQGKVSFKLLVAGDGPLAKDLTNQVETRGLSGVVELLGYRDDVPGLMASADVLVLPSYREGTPRVITEALAAGTPVVSTQIAGIPEQVEEGVTGFLVEPGDVNNLINRLHRLLADREMRITMGERAMESVTKFDVAEAKEAYRKLYAELLTVNS